MIITYNKLIRDKIPEIITVDGKTAVTEILSDTEYIKMLDEKLTEELADMLEVIYAIVKTKGISIAEFEKLRIDKADKRGGFDKKILLKEVVEK